MGSSYVIPAALKTAASSLASGKSVTFTVTFLKVTKGFSPAPTVYTGKF